MQVWQHHTLSVLQRDISVYFPLYLQCAIWVAYGSLYDKLIAACLQVEPHPRDFGRSLGAALDFNFQEHVGMLNQLVGLMGALPVHKEDSPLMTFKRFVL